MRRLILLSALLLAAPGGPGTKCAYAQPADVIVSPSGPAFDVRVQTGDPVGTLSASTASIGVYRTDTMVEIACTPAGDDEQVTASVVVSRSDVAPNGLGIMARAWDQTGCGGRFVDSLHVGTMVLGNPQRPWLSLLRIDPTTG